MTVPPPARPWRPYTPLQGAAEPLLAAATEGDRIYLADGRPLVDAVSSWWTACHGYNHPHILTAMRAQMAAMPHVMFGGLSHAPAERLAARLGALLPGNPSRVFFCDSGSVAVEIAMKMALQYWLNRGIAGRHRFVSFEGAYHGDTIGAMSVCDPTEGMHALFNGLLPRQHVVPLPRGRDTLSTFERFLAGVRDEVAAVIVEPLVQAAGGFHFHDAETLAAIRAIAERNDVLFIADEIATGFGRTGRMFACEEASIAPDIICVGKALTGGTISLAAVAAGARVVEAFSSDDPQKALMHGPTYMANPLACAAANASLDLFMMEPRLDQVRAIERSLAEALEPARALPGVADVRVKGAIGVIELALAPDVDWLKAQFIDRGVWLRPFGRVIYAMPAFVISAKALSAICDAMVSVTRAWSERPPP